MLKAAVSTIDFCTRFAYFTVALALLISGFAVHYTVHHFAISTDTSKVFSKDVPWLQRKNEFDKLFPNRNEGYILALVSISILLWITLRRFGDVLLTLVPLLLA